MRREGEVWEIVIRDRRKRRRINKDIGEEEWKEHLMRLLGRVENRVVRGKGRDIRGGDEKEEISKRRLSGLLGS